MSFRSVYNTLKGMKPLAGHQIKKLVNAARAMPIPGVTRAVKPLLPQPGVGGAAKLITKKLKRR